MKARINTWAASMTIDVPDWTQSITVPLWLDNSDLLRPKLDTIEHINTKKVDKSGAVIFGTEPEMK